MSGERTLTSRQIDELLRNVLRVGDPRDPSQIAAALRSRYSDASRRLDQEATGLAMVPEGYAPAARLQQEASATRTADKALEHVRRSAEADLDVLIKEPANREWTPDLEGWRDILLRELEEGSGAAQQSPDSSKRDRVAFAIRHMLDYGWLARLLAVMHSDVNREYRRLAATLDKGADVLRVMLGAGLFQAGYADGGLLVQVPQADLMQRRDAVLRALRMFTGTEDDGENWGDGPASCRRLEEVIDQSGAPELKIYLREETLAPVLERLVKDAFSSSGSAGAPFPASSPAAFEKLQLQRFVAIAERQLSGAVGMERLSRNKGMTQIPNAEPVSPGLSAFVYALKFFLTPFETDRAGARYIDLAVPLPIALWQVNEEDATARTILRDLVSVRAELAYEVDTLVRGYSSAPAELDWQVVVDRALFSIDRSVDLLALGGGRPSRWGEAELRALAHRKVLEALVSRVQPGLLGEAIKHIPVPVKDQLVKAEKILGKLNGPGAGGLAQVVRDVGHEELSFLEHIVRMARDLAPRERFEPGGFDAEVLLNQLLQAAGYDRLRTAQPPLVPPMRVSLNNLTWALINATGQFSQAAESRARTVDSPPKATPPDPGGPGGKPAATLKNDASPDAHQQLRGLITDSAEMFSVLRERLGGADEAQFSEATELLPGEGERFLDVLGPALKAVARAISSQGDYPAGAKKLHNRIANHLGDIEEAITADPPGSLAYRRKEVAGALEGIVTTLKDLANKATEWEKAS